MSRCRITRLEIQGFRAFGRAIQTLDFPSSLAAVLGSNSQGKTSLAEAVEFLLTGQIVRRALMSSSQDEFADALRNAHMSVGTAVFVEAVIVGTDGNTRTIRRTLKTDYGKRQDCETLLEIDRKASTEADLLACGIILSQPPLRAPVLAQHTLGYVFSVRPQDRANYFKALLEVTDLEDFRNQVAGIEREITGPADPLIAKLERAARISEAGLLLELSLLAVPTGSQLDTTLNAYCRELISAMGETPPADNKALFAQLESMLAEKRAKTFALNGFERRPLPPWSAPPKLDSLGKYIAERSKVDAETRRLAALFREALALPHVAAAEDPIDCPLCASKDALTPGRIAHLRDRVGDTESFQKARKDASDTLAQMQRLAKSVEDTITPSLPSFITTFSRSRRVRGFRVERIRSLLGDTAKAEIDSWLKLLRRTARARTKVLIAARSLSALIGGHLDKPESLLDVAGLSSGFSAVAIAYEQFASELAAYDRAERVVSRSLQVVVDAQSKTIGWQELIEIAADQLNLRKALVVRAAHEQTAKELTQALRQIDRGNEQVLEGKFRDLSAGVQKWWNLLRPDEMSFFSGVQPRPGAHRTIDFKAGLSTKSDRSDTKLRDVVAVFSQSQLHCLGLALFLARSEREGTGFIVLDDPILSSDEDYRAFFNAMVLDELLKMGVQVVVLTQDQRTWKDLGERYLHENVALFQITLQSPADGSIVTNEADDLQTRFNRADVLIRGGHPSLRKQAGEIIRDTAERFCKEVLVRHRRINGYPTASLGDYDGKNLGDLSPRVEPLLVHDASHPGKLRTIAGAVNPAKHDDAIPASGVLKVALGDLRFLKKTYL